MDEENFELTRDQMILVMDGLRRHLTAEERVRNPDLAEAFDTLNAVLQRRNAERIARMREQDDPPVQVR